MRLLCSAYGHGRETMPGSLRVTISPMRFVLLMAVTRYPALLSGA